MIKQLKKGLFKSNDGVSRSVSFNDVNIYSKDDTSDYPDDYKYYIDALNEEGISQLIEDVSDVAEYAITINISPHKLINKRKWAMYAHQQQQEILFRMEASSLKNTPIKCIKAVFEMCPRLKQIHMHALYEMPKNLGYQAYIKEWWDSRISTTDKNTIIPFRHFDSRDIYDRNGWNKYIMKDQIIKKII